MLYIIGHAIFYLQKILEASSMRKINVDKLDYDELAVMMARLADMCDKYGLDRFEEVK